MLSLANDDSLMVEKAIKVSSQVRVASVTGRVARDGLDCYYFIHSAGEDKVRNMQNNWADRVHGIFKRRRS